MCKRILWVLAAAGLVSGLAFASPLAQNGDDKKMSDDKTPGAASKNMSHKEAMDKMSAMSEDEKAAMFDKTTQRQKMSAMKMSGNQMGGEGMSGGMTKISDLSAKQKADMFDKMPIGVKMSAMHGGSAMHHGSKKMGGMKMDQ